MERTHEAIRLAREIASKLDELSSRTTPIVRSLRREYSRLLASASPELVIRIALRLASGRDLMCRFVAYELIQHHRSARSSLTLAHILKLGQGIGSWAAVDCFARYLSGPAWRDGLLPDTVVRGWSQTADRWWRRAALVSTVELSRRGETADVRRTIEICTLLAADRDDMVAKALSWALRELAKKHPDEARGFLVKHKDILGSRVRREVLDKIVTGRKNPRLKARKGIGEFRASPGLPDQSGTGTARGPSHQG